MPSGLKWIWRFFYALIPYLIFLVQREQLQQLFWQTFVFCRFKRNKFFVQRRTI